MHKISTAAIATTVALLLAAVFVPSASAADAAPGSTPAAAAKAEVAQGRGSIVKVDAAAGVLNVKHEAIPKLQWPAMTMDFKLADKKLLAGLKPGQTITFGLVKDASGAYVISRVEAGK